MQNIQDVFSRIRSTKREQKQLKQVYKDALEASREYKEVAEKLRGYKLRKKQIEDGVKSELSSDYAKIEALKKDAELDKELLADIAINKLMAGEKIKVEDEDKNEYEPIFSVKFRKANVSGPQKSA